MLPTVTSGKIWTHTSILRQVIPNSYLDFTANAFHQDFVLFGLPANHIILATKVVVLLNFDAGQNNTATMYLGNSNVFPTPDGTINATFVNNIHNCYGTQLLTIPSSSDSSYQYGSFRWFTLSAPGTSHTTSAAYCLPQRMDAHDVIARVVVQGNSSVRINLINQGLVQITVQYMAI